MMFHFWLSIYTSRIELRIVTKAKEKKQKKQKLSAGFEPGHFVDKGVL